MLVLPRLATEDGKEVLIFIVTDLDTTSAETSSQ
jgi:hypothetical protein